MNDWGIRKQHGRGCREKKRLLYSLMDNDTMRKNRCMGIFLQKEKCVSDIWLALNSMTGLGYKKNSDQEVF